ncbi:MAG TPA: ethanolamine ammonia-lyase light chain EutC, partial [Gemmataceae bacterium]|nr:ethanolamine ammonia-lyase light chain EutC [Gemmataceae bacterium]
MNDPALDPQGSKTRLAATTVFKPRAEAASDAGLDLLSAIRARTPARLLVGRSGTAYGTATQLELRQDHAAARDAVQAELNLQRDLGAEFVG